MTDIAIEQIQPKVYRQFTLGTLREHLAALPADTPLAGIGHWLTSYRDFYDDVAIEPGRGTTAGALLSLIDDRIGDTMEGWGGGTYPITADCRVYFAEYGNTGPALIGFDGPVPVLLGGAR